MCVIVEMTVENVKRIVAANIRPGISNVIGGDHGAGKTSLMDSIEYALAGKSSFPAEPLRRGAKRGRIVLDLGEIVVTRNFKADGDSTLTVKSKDGKNVTSPQAVLDKMCGKLTFDPEQFVRLKSAEQATMLRELVGIDFTKLDIDRKDNYDDRTAVNKAVTQLEGELKGIPYYGLAPKKEEKLADILAESQRIQAHNSANEKVRESLEKARMAAKQRLPAIQTAKDEIAELETKLAKAKDKLVAAEQAIVVANAEADAIAMTVAALKDLDAAAVDTRLSTAEESNAQVRSNAKRKEIETKLEAARKSSQNLTDRIEEIDDKKAKMLSEAKFPLAGLGFDDNGVTFEGLPFEQSNTATQIEVSARMGFAMHKDLRVMLIRNGSLLLPEKLAVLGRIAEEHDGQVWIERVGEGEECSVIISDGHIKQSSESHELASVAD